ncbi:transporter substrate-binding domain-containing protein [Tropicimonas sp. IMCC34011]|uniref:transporter substrate-binding domain-containing protein n=1 Tax=Tropicimonas sp. IMCC34011 TaxID=2248759 RepID=UPI000E2399F5|nr:transporter substrate-binding domain-containing protein [Tropicimonas sp. IMCC34011]
MSDASMNDEDLRRAYAPTGRLRVALNHGNAVLVSRDESGTAHGISVDLARALADRLGLQAVFLDHERAVEVSSTAEDDRWDVCFLAVDPDRAKTIHFTNPYIRIEGCYLAGAETEVADSKALIAEGLKVGTVKGSAYTLHLKRQQGAENLVEYENLETALAALDEGQVAAIAGIREAMETKSETRPGTRVLQPPFMEIRQAMGLPTGRPDAAAHLDAFIAEMARAGRVGEILERHGVSKDCAIVP